MQRYNKFGEGGSFGEGLRTQHEEDRQVEDPKSLEQLIASVHALQTASPTERLAGLRQLTPPLLFQHAEWKTLRDRLPLALVEQLHARAVQQQIQHGQEVARREHGEETMEEEVSQIPTSANESGSQYEKPDEQAVG